MAIDASHPKIEYDADSRKGLLMNSTRAAIATCLLSLIVVSACEKVDQSGRSAGDADQKVPTVESVSDSARTATILKVAKEYKQYDQMLDEAALAPMLCRAPMPQSMLGAEYHLSDSDESSPHGRKLYFLFASDATSYARLREGDREQPVGQTIVKESWYAEETEDTRRLPDPPPPRIEATIVQPGFPFENGPTYRLGDKGPLFVMQFLGEGAPDTDNGWIYATLTPDGQTITSIGQLDSCMRCHVDAPYNRLFGVSSFPVSAETRSRYRANAVAGD